jgi:hypothetical protein
MLLTQEIAEPIAQRMAGRESKQNEEEYLAGALVIREVPVLITGERSLASDHQATLHYSRLQIEGIERLIPEAIEIDVTPLAGGGQMRIDQIPLPPCCEVIGVWFANPIVTVGPSA